ncbi:MAG TPA: histidinol dehydrogenase [Firmicutes bacterium]|nr:histidinol dehydrogenase [Bacillota bacterium]
MIPELSAEEFLARRRHLLGLQESVARRVIEQVREQGDEALARLTWEFDRVRLDAANLGVTPGEVKQAYQVVDRQFIEALEHAKRNVQDFHERQLQGPWTYTSPDGARLGQALVPVDRVGIYVPGGTAAYPSTVVMTAIPAKVAGVGQVIMCTPPGPDGKVNPYTLVAADLCGVDKVFRLGGAQAIAAMAYGTGTIPAVDKIVGPGNAFVTAAKKLVFGDVGIDMLAGPSEVLIIADDSAIPEFVAADLLSQAEHDVLASALLLTTSRDLAGRVIEAIEGQISSLPRRGIIERALGGNGAIVLVHSLDQAVEIANMYAPEHVEIMVRDPHAISGRLRSAGTVFLGPYSPEPVGDYIAGPNHVLPTLGAARYRGGLGTQDFLKPINIVEYSKSALEAVAEHAIRLARTEGLTAHANSVEVRLTFGAPDAVPISVGAVSTGPTGAWSGDDATGGAVEAIQNRKRLIKLDANESPYDMPGNLKQEIVEALARLPFNRYPSADADELRESLARLLGVRDDMIVVGVGSDELIQIIMLAFREKVKKVVTVYPSFSMYRYIAGVVGIPIKEIPLGEGFSFDMDTIAGELSREDTLAFFCNPNNPTGGVYTGELKHIIESTRGLVVIDEAYHEFCGDTLLDRVSDRVIVLRTLSKAFGLAGLRIGYGIMHPDIAKQVNRAKLPYNCSAISILVAQKVLEHPDDVRRVVNMITRERERLYKRLAGLGVEAYPSSANFILFRPPGPAQEFHKSLLDMGIAVRRFDRPVEYLRVTVGLPEENDAFIEAVSKLRQA